MLETRLGSLRLVGSGAPLDRPLGGDWPYSWLDATYLKQREGGRIVSVAATIAVAANTEGKREIVGRHPGPSEAETVWATFIDDSEADVLAHLDFPAQHRSKIHSTNPLERPNKEVERRADVLGIFPNDGSIIRLIGAVLLEANDEWALQHRYIQIKAMAELTPPSADTVPTQLSTVAASSKATSATPQSPPRRRTSPQKALHYALAVKFQSDVQGTPYVKPPASLLRGFGLDRKLCSRVLLALERAGLIEVRRSPGRTAQVKLLDPATPGFDPSAWDRPSPPDRHLPAAPRTYGREAKLGASKYPRLAGSGHRCQPIMAWTLRHWLCCRTLTVRTSGGRLCHPHHGLALLDRSGQWCGSKARPSWASKSHPRRPCVGKSVGTQPSWRQKNSV